LASIASGRATARVLDHRRARDFAPLASDLFGADRNRPETEQKTRWPAAAPARGHSIGRDVAGRIIGKTARRPARRRDGGELVRGRGIGVSRLYGVGGGGGRIDGLRRPVASRIIGPGVGAVIADGGSQAMGRTIGEALRLSLVGEGWRIAGELIVRDRIQRLAGPGERAVDDIGGCRGRGLGDDPGDAIVGVARESLDDLVAEGQAGGPAIGRPADRGGDRLAGRGGTLPSAAPKWGLSKASP
jgi:hypothetical protein